MLRLLPLVLLAVQAADPALISSMDDLQVTPPKEKGRVEVVEGKVGKAVKFSFDEGSSGAFCITRLHGSPEWDKAAGFSFWVKGDGSKAFGGIQFIWNEDYAARYDLMFPVDGTEWRKISVAWRDLAPVNSNPNAKPLDPKNGNAPSKLSGLWFGKWWYWKAYPAHSYTIDEMRLEARIDLDQNLYKPAGAPLERVVAKLKAGKPVTIVTMGDSLTDIRHWANRKINWPALLVQKVKEKYGSTVTIVNPAIGGTELRQNLVLIPRWLAEAPEPDLVTICFGGNDWESGMRADLFKESALDAIDRVRRATHGKADVLFLTTVPSLEKWTTRDELGVAARAAAADRNAGIGDPEKLFHAAAEADRAKLFCTDKVHLDPPGHETVVASVMAALEKAGK